MKWSHWLKTMPANLMTGQTEVVVVDYYGNYIPAKLLDFDLAKNQLHIHVNTRFAEHSVGEFDV